MGELARKIGAIKVNADRVRNLAAEASEVAEVRDRLDQLKAVKNRIQEVAATASALSVRDDELFVKTQDARNVAGELMTALGKSGAPLPKPVKLQQLKDKLDGLASDVRGEVIQAWSTFKELNITSGVFALLETAESLGSFKDANVVRARLDVAQRMIVPPNAETVQATLDAIGKYKLIRAELSDGDEKLEVFIIAVTGRGVTLQQMEEFPKGKQWLEANNMLDKLFVVMRKD